MKRSTKHSLIMSALSLLLCASMLIGTTFAWFTDSVTSTGNIIKSGTLDVSLEWMEGKQDPADKNSADWKDASEGAIFNYSNWEPGFTQVKHIKIENEGTLALKYKVNVVPTGTVEYPDGVNLADVIDVYYLDPAQQMDDRAELPASARLGTLTEMLAGLTTSGTGTLKTQGEAVTVTLALKMQESAGNEYQNRSFGTEFAVQLLATQVEHEDDSFDNTYDKDATYPASKTVVIPSGTTATVEIPISVEEVTVTLPVGTEAGVYEVRVDSKTVETDSVTNETTVTFNIELYKDGVKVSNTGTEYEVDIEIGKDLVLNKVMHKNEEVTVYSYNPFSGILTFKTDSFSPFSVVFRDIKADDIISADTADIFISAMENGGLYKLTDDITIPADVVPVIPEGKTVTLDLNGKKLQVENIGTQYALTNQGTLNIIDSVGTGSISARGIYNGYDVENAVGAYTNAVLNVENVTINCCSTNGGGAAIFNYGIATINGGNFTSLTSYSLNNQSTGVMTVSDATVSNGIYNVGDLTLNDCTVATVRGEYSHAVYSSGSKLIINGGTFTGNGNEVVNANATPTEINGGTFKKVEKTSYLIAGSNTTIYDGMFLAHESNPAGHPVRPDVTVKGGTFNYKHTNIAEGYEISDNGDGTWTVAKVRAISMNGKGYDTLSDAFAEVTEGAVIKLNEDVALTEALVYNKDVAATLNMNGHEISGLLDVVLKIEDGKLAIKDGAIKNVQSAPASTKYAICLSGDAVAEIKNVDIEVIGVGISMTGNSKITELNANISASMNNNGSYCYDAITLDGNARIDLISGGEYTTAYTTEFIQSWYNSDPKTVSEIISYTVNLISSGASIGEISGGTFLGVMDRANNGTPIHVNAGKVELISGGYFGFVKNGLQNPIRMMFINTSKGASIDAITGGTFERGSLNNSWYGTGFVDAVDASGYALVDTGNTVDVNIQFSTKVTTYTLNVFNVVAK